MKIEWRKCILQSNCRLSLLNLNNEHFDNLTGVYVIWSGKNKGNVIRVGQGIIRDELIEMKINKKVREYGPDLFVTWAAVPGLSLEGVEAFLNNKLIPKINHSKKDIELIDVNLP